MYTIYLQSKKSVRHLILLYLGTVVLSGCSQSHQLEKVPENQQPSQPTSTESPATEVPDGVSDTGQPNTISEDASGVGKTGYDAVVSSGESDAGSAQPNTISEDASGVERTDDNAVVSSGESDAGSAQPNTISEDASGVGITNNDEVVSNGESDAGSAQPNTILEDASGVGKTGYDAVVSNGESDDTYSDPDADKSIYLVNTKGENTGGLGCWPDLQCFWKTCTP
jgi:hypothetical protein